MTYYDTTHLTKPELHEARKKAASQEQRILGYFYRKHATTPGEIWNWYYGHYGACPLTSVRRAVTNLAAKGLIVKTDMTKPGVYGRPEHCWVLAAPKPEQMDFL